MGGFLDVSGLPVGGLLNINCFLVIYCIPEVLDIAEFSEIGSEHGMAL